jgi:hypothetical protein
MEAVWVLMLHDHHGGWPLGVFSTRERALAWLADAKHVPAGALLWQPSPHSPDYWEARLPHGDQRYTLTRHTIDPAAL